MTTTPISKHSPQQLANVAEHLVKIAESMALMATPALAPAMNARLERVKEQRDLLVERARRVDQ